MVISVSVGIINNSFEEIKEMTDETEETNYFFLHIELNTSAQIKDNFVTFMFFLFLVSRTCIFIQSVFYF